MKNDVVKHGKKGICTQERIFYGMVTISEKGQIAVPVDIRRDLDIKTGDRLLVIRRRDNVGLILLKQDIMDDLMTKIQDDDRFFDKITGGTKK
jgi:AbrB family looped-hinge helix DNA binding protein